VEKLWAMRRIGEIIDELDLRGKNDELIQELVRLSTKHGILTPYTSFLADENAAPGSLAGGEAGVRRAAMLLDRLHEADGKAAFAQRAEKNQLQNANGLAAAPAPQARPPPAISTTMSRPVMRCKWSATRFCIAAASPYSYDVAQPSPSRNQDQGRRAVQRRVLPPGP
jgi:Ca-activated chloride channel family protein